MASSLSKEVLVKMSKPDLENLCFERNLPTSGTTRELREQLLAEEVEDAAGEDRSKMQETVRNEEERFKASAGEASAQQFVERKVAGKSDDATLTVLLQWMMKQEESRREEEKRRDAESRRWEAMMKMMEGRTSTRNSS